jgi:hypothetical protein
MQGKRGQVMKRTIHNTVPNRLVTDTLKQRQCSNAVRDWLQLLEDLDVQFLVLDPAADRAAIQLVRAHPAWHLEFEDAEAAFFAHIQVKGDHPDQLKNSST